MAEVKAVPFKLNLGSTPTVLKRVVALLYGGAGDGKTVAAMSVLKNPNLNVRVIVMEDNCVPGIQAAMAIHGITELREGQLLIASPAMGGADTSEAFIAGESDVFFNNAVKKLLDYSGIDALTGKEVKIGHYKNFKSNDVIILDGVTMVQYAAQAAGRKKSRDDNTSKDPRAGFYKGQDLLNTYIYQLIQNSSCHVIVLAHSTVSITDDKSGAKNIALDLPTIHPALGTRSIVEPFCGRFQHVLYCEQNAPGALQPYVWNGAKKDALVISSRLGLTPEKLAQYSYQGTGAKANAKSPITMTTLPPDFTHPLYDLF